MSSKSIRPSTMTGIKRLARQIKSKEGLSHNAALAKASAAAGYENLRHAQHKLPSQQPAVPVPRHPLFLTAYWRDLDTGKRGRETLTITLNARWQELLTPNQLKSARGVWNFRPEGPDHLCKRSWTRSQNGAREAVCHAARTFQFVDATRLRPSSGYCRAYPNGNADNHVPGQDHVCVWFDDEKRYLIADEPYEMAEAHKREARIAWFSVHGYQQIKPTWPGMHNPYGGTSLYLIADAAEGVPLEPLVRSLNRLPAPPSATDWKGESAPVLPYFVSPGSISEVRKPEKKDRVSSTHRRCSTRSSLPYTRPLSGRKDLRPNGQMPIPLHAQIGGLLKSVLVATLHRKGVYNRVDAVRCDLDEWVQREYDSVELPNEQFFDLYYRETGATFTRRLLEAERSRHVLALAEVKTVLTKYYPDCTPLRAMLKRLDGAIASLNNWTS